MKYLCAYALAWLSGNKTPKSTDLAHIIESIGGDFDKSRAETLCDLLAERDLTEVIKAGIPKLQAFAGASSAAPVVTETKKATEQTKEEKGEEKGEEAEIEGAMDLFGGDEW